MKHWDLVPGERVRLGTSPCEYPDPRYGQEAVFQFRSTTLACFIKSSGGEWLELEVLDSGHLRDRRGFAYYIAGRDRETRLGAWA